MVQNNIKKRILMGSK